MYVIEGDFMHIRLSLLLLSLMSFFYGCSTPKIAPVKVDTIEKNVSYLKDVKPILDKRCVTCHSCYNSPCQAKFSSFEGVDRGASKLEVYNAERLVAMEPTRLFIDAKSTAAWREKQFFTLTESKESNSSYNDSIMMHLLYDKKMHPEIVGEYSPESDDLSCPANKSELEAYIDKKPNHGMPYGFPPLKESEYRTVASWLATGAKGPTAQEQKALTTPSKVAQKEIKKWEAFFNASDAKHQMSARYLYEHLYLGHLYFPDAKGEFFTLVRSTTPSGEAVEIIPTLRPFDAPKREKFYYRFVKVHATLVHKTHMPFQLDDSVLARFNELFIEPEWYQTPHTISYDVSLSANPFRAFEQIPMRSRYQFLLDNAHYIVKNFIRGPVCRGQMALNVIHDHFWVMFQDPKYDVALQHPEFIHEQFENLALPIDTSNKSVFKTFSDEYKKRYRAYYKAKEKLRRESSSLSPLTLKSIWAGEKASDAPMLTIYRHFDSASCHKGALGEEPRTVWVIDYAQFERIYYNLVAGYDVFGNISHQTNVRRYTDFLRLEGELNFLEYLPYKERKDKLKSWYIGAYDDADLEDITLDKIQSAITYKGLSSKSELLQKVIGERFIKSVGIAFDPINYAAPNQRKPEMPQQFSTKADLINAIKSITEKGSGFVRFMNDSGANNMFLRVKMPDGSYMTRNLVINRWHDNVNSLFAESHRLDSSKDSIDILSEPIGSYPNAFVDVAFEDFEDFIKLMKYMSGTDDEIRRLKHYFVSRSDPRFWEIFDWFSENYKQRDPINAGLYDLNRYARTHWESK